MMVNRKLLDIALLIPDVALMHDWWCYVPRYSVWAYGLYRRTIGEIPAAWHAVAFAPVAKPEG